MLTIPEIINNSHKCFSFEIVPPLRGHSQTELLRATEKLTRFNPAFISITNHPCVGETCGDSSLHLVKKRPGTFGISVAVKEQFGIHVVPHLIGLGRNAESFEDEVIDLIYAGFHDFFCIKGDHAKVTNECPEYESLETVEMIQRLKAIACGNYLYSSKQGEPLAVSIGIAGYPNNMSHEAIEKIQQKVQEGASWLITQMIFSAEEFEVFSKQLQSHGIHIPVIPGIRVISNMHTLGLVEEAFSIKTPEKLKRAFFEAKTPEQERKAGMQFAEKLITDLLDKNVPVIHIFTMGRSKDVSEVLRGL